MIYALVVSSSPRSEKIHVAKTNTKSRYSSVDKNSRVYCKFHRCVSLTKRYTRYTIRKKGNNLTLVTSANAFSKETSFLETASCNGEKARCSYVYAPISCLLGKNNTHTHAVNKKLLQIFIGENHNTPPAHKKISIAVIILLLIYRQTLKNYFFDASNVKRFISLRFSSISIRFLATISPMIPRETKLNPIVISIPEIMSD